MISNSEAKKRQKESAGSLVFAWRKVHKRMADFSGAANKAVPGHSWTTMRCDDPKCAETHKHTQILTIDKAGGSSGEGGVEGEEGEQGGEEERLRQVPPASRIITPQDVSDVAFSPGEETIFVIGTQGMKVTVIAGLEAFAGSLEVLVLRSNLIASLDGVEPLTCLKKLELYDNQVENFEARHLQGLTQLTVLDLSFNAIRSMAAVACCPLLQELYLAQNKLKVVEGLHSLSELQILDLGANRIRSLAGCGLETCVALRSLWLGKNKIEALADAGIGALQNLEKLDVQNNRLVCVLSGEVPLSVRELYLACNGLASLEGGLLDLCAAGKLHTLDLSSNPLRSLEGVGGFGPCLEELWLTSVQLQEPADLEPLRGLERLQCLYLEHSPVMKALAERYQPILREIVPSLIQIDALCL